MGFTFCGKHPLLLTGFRGGGGDKGPFVVLSILIYCLNFYSVSGLKVSSNNIF